MDLQLLLQSVRLYLQLFVGGLMSFILLAVYLKSDSTHHFIRNACTKSGSLRFSQFFGCWLILSVYILMSFDFPFVRLFGNFVITLINYAYLHIQLIISLILQLKIWPESFSFFVFIPNLDVFIDEAGECVYFYFFNRIIWRMRNNKFLERDGCVCGLILNHFVGEKKNQNKVPWIYHELRPINLSLMELNVVLYSVWYDW